MSDIDYLVEFVRRHEIITVLSGAGCSTASGIPDYRDEDGNWKHPQPVQYGDFVNNGNVRKRYWAGSYAGWSRIVSAAPNAAHRALADLERSGRIASLITQNVDNLHRQAGSRTVIDLHGVLQKTRCLHCNLTGERNEWQARLEDCNPDWDAAISRYAPDGDAELTTSDYLAFKVPDCPCCGGVIKPDVVFFGEPVPRETVIAATELLERSDALLIVGSSLMVFSGYRFVRLARNSGIPLVIINRGRTRADEIANRKFSTDCTEMLPRLVDALAA
ncbi:MAG: NAD-dependent protein deacetylase [Woeseia sp.]